MNEKFKMSFFKRMIQIFRLEKHFECYFLLSLSTSNDDIFDTARSDRIPCWVMPRYVTDIQISSFQIMWVMRVIFVLIRKSGAFLIEYFPSNTLSQLENDTINNCNHVNGVLGNEYLVMRYIFPFITPLFYFFILMKWLQTQSHVPIITYLKNWR